jgi:predicted methyltransferase
MAVPPWLRVPIVSGRTAQRMLRAGEGALEVSLDLGCSRAQVRVGADAIVLPDGTSVARDDLAAAFSAPEDCVRLDGGLCRKVYHYGEAEHRYYKLFQPFEDRAPTVIINGATMHAIVGKDPWTDTAEKVACVSRATGACLDTCCGLGYSAQMLAARFEGVTTCEVDANVLAVAAVNPWSEGLFGMPNVEVRNADLRELLAVCAPGRFGCIFHDPPTVHQAGELYAESLYRRFRAALSRGGVLYHYVGEPGRKHGQDYAAGVMRRLRNAGFGRVRRVTGGVLAFRGAGRGRPQA